MAAQSDVLIIGGGAAGMTVAALLQRTRPALSVTIVEPSARHFYQPAWTLVGAGEFAVDDTVKRTADLMPKGATWIQQRAKSFKPADSQVTLEDGSVVNYRYLVVAAGLQLDWHKIEGLKETLGKNQVTSNYSFDCAPYTWECIRNHRDGRALFTQPAMPIKCAGAPQKILYMAADYFRRHKVDTELSFLLPGAAMFGIPFFSKALDVVVAEYGIVPRFAHNLVAVDGARRVATFEHAQGAEKKRVDVEFGLLHVVPPQSAPDFIKTSPLADPSGWVIVDKHSLRHPAYENVFALGDCTTTPNSKTAAAVRAQAPVLVANLLAATNGQAAVQSYDGYASCPLTTSIGRVMLAEFGYDGAIMPSFPLDPRVPRRMNWWLKRYYLPRLYWQMVSTGVGPDWHRPRTYADALPAIAA
jgi:sulfide:quinone oxidoreductase